LLAADRRRADFTFERGKRSLKLDTDKTGPVYRRHETGIKRKERGELGVLRFSYPTPCIKRAFK